MRKRGGEIHRAQEDVDIVEIGRPGGPGSHSPSFLLNNRRQWGKILLARLLERKEQPHLKSEGFGNLPRVGALRPRVRC
jgi:hypothetical protein